MKPNDATGQNGKAAVYEIDSNYHVEGNKFSGNVLPEYWGNITHAAFDPESKKIILETLKDKQPKTYLWNPYSAVLLDELKEIMHLKAGDTNYGLLEIMMADPENKFY